METTAATCRFSTLNALGTRVALNTSCRKSGGFDPKRELSHHGGATFMHVPGVRGQKRVIKGHFCRIMSHKAQVERWHEFGPKPLGRALGRVQAADQCFARASAEESLVDSKASLEDVPRTNGPEMSPAISEPTSLKPANVSQRLVTLALGLTLVLGSLTGVQAAHADDNAGLQEAVTTLLDSSSDGQGGAESVAAKAEVVEEKASAAIDSAKEKLDKVEKGVAALIEGAKDGPGGEEEAKQVAQKAEELKKQTSEEVSATLKSAEKMKEGAKLLAEAAGVEIPGVLGGASESAGQGKQTNPQESSLSEKQGEKTESKGSGSDSTAGSQKQGFQGFFSALKERINGAKEGIAKVPDAINKGSKGAVKDEAPAGVESGIKNAVKEGVSGSVKEGLTGAVTGGVGGGVAGAATGAAKGAISGATGS